jgi:hypothetical protein
VGSQANIVELPHLSRRANRDLIGVTSTARPLHATTHIANMLDRSPITSNLDHLMSANV